MNSLYSIFEVFFIVLIGAQVFYYLLFAIAGLFKHTPEIKPSSKMNRIAVLVPGFKEDTIIVNTALRALEQSYPRQFYEVVVLADSFRESTLRNLRKLEVTLLEVEFENSTKAKSLNFGLEHLSAHPPDLVVVLDSDNIMAPDFLQKVNAAYNSGMKIIQGHRTAKNKETPFALLDAINEEIGNSIFRRGHRVLGMSSATIGSAMAFEYNYYRHLMEGVLDTAGEDKVVELKILKERKTVHYLDDALVYDEKVSNGKSFSSQRRRWVGVQIDIFRKYHREGIRELILKGNLDYFDKIFQAFLIPKILLVGFLFIMGSAGIAGFVDAIWVYLTCSYFGALLIAVPRRFYNWHLIKAVVNIPLAVVYMLRSVLTIRKSTATFFEVTQKTQL